VEYVRSTLVKDMIKNETFIVYDNRLMLIKNTVKYLWKRKENSRSIGLVPKDLLNICKTMYWALKSRVKYKNQISEQFQCMLGERQGHNNHVMCTMYNVWGKTLQGDRFFVAFFFSIILLQNLLNIFLDILLKMFQIHMFIYQEKNIVVIIVIGKIVLSRSLLPSIAQYLVADVGKVTSVAIVWLVKVQLHL
jgi:hypothetical protein